MPKKGDLHAMIKRLIQPGLKANILCFEELPDDGGAANSSPHYLPLAHIKGAPATLLSTPSIGLWHGPPSDPIRPCVFVNDFMYGVPIFISYEGYEKSPAREARVGLKKKAAMLHKMNETEFFSYLLGSTEWTAHDLLTDHFYLISRWSSLAREVHNEHFPRVELTRAAQSGCGVAQELCSLMESFRLERYKSLSPLVLLSSYFWERAAEVYMRNNMHDYGNRCLLNAIAMVRWDLGYNTDDPSLVEKILSRIESLRCSLVDQCDFFSAFVDAHVRLVRYIPARQWKRNDVIESLINDHRSFIESVCEAKIEG